MGGTLNPTNPLKPYVFHKTKDPLGLVWGHPPVSPSPEPNWTLQVTTYVHFGLLLVKQKDLNLPRNSLHLLAVSILESH
jgi:hypothetical protein